MLSSIRPVFVLRRAVAGAMVCVFTLQGSAAAAPLSSRSNDTPLMAQLQIDVATVLANVKTTYLGALLTGTADRWNAMHAPAPQRVFAPRTDASKVILREKIRPLSRGAGFRGNPPPMLSRPLSPANAGKLRAPISSLGSTSGLAAAIRLSARASIVTRASTPSGIHALSVSMGSLNLTGINPWWTYEEGALPGTGKYMVNVGNGNLITQSDDIDIPERGIDLAFRRTYNSMSLNDTNAAAGNDDGSPNEDVYGNGWTNTFDAHLALNTAGGISVFDIDGARYDYTPNGTGCFTPPPGMYYTLCGDGSGGGYFWGKKNGTIYYFYNPSDGASIAGYAGRLYRIYARNQYNYIQLNYYWTGGDSSSSQNLTQIIVQHSDGQALTLAFGMVNGRPLLSSITLPNGSQVTYSMSTAHDLVSVGNLGNNSASVLTENYGYYAGDKIAWTSNPRWNLAGGNDGSFTNFYYDGSNRVNGVLLYGFANIVPNDGTNTALQPAYGTGANTMAYSTFSYATGGETSLTDVDGHATNWFYDGLARVTQTSDWTGSLWLVTYASWDGNDNLSESVDARGNPTDYAYDSNGNTVAEALPSVSTSQGTFRPTTLYSYDRTSNANNIVEVCDPVFTHQRGQDWVANPGTSDSLCPNISGATRYSWDYTDGAEPFGRLQAPWTPLNYHRTYSYSSGSQGGDFGLPTSVAGDSVSQNDGTTRTPSEQFIYDGYGNLVCFSNLQDTNGTHWSRLTYDSLNRRTAVADPDDATLSVSQCPNNAGIPGSYIVTTTTYNADGSIATTQSPSQHASGLSASYSYNADGNPSAETHYYGSGPGTIQKFYDGADRLVEVIEPTDEYVPLGNGNYTADLYPWLTRYLYDLTENGQVAMQYGSGYSAHGNLFKTQRYLPAAVITTTTTVPQYTVQSSSRRAESARKAKAVSKMRPTHALQYKPPFYAMHLRKNAQILQLRPRTRHPESQMRNTSGAVRPMLYPNGSGQWMDVGGTAYDALDRKVDDYRYVPGANTISTRAYTYDSSDAGLLNRETTPVGDQKNYSYDSNGHMSAISFNVSSASKYTPGRSYTFDPDGRVASVGNNEFGTWTYQYDADGRLSVSQEPSGGSGIPGFPYASGTITSPGTFNYGYYADGMPSSLSLNGAQSFSQNMSYRGDGIPTSAYFSVIGQNITRQYTFGGRLTQRSDPTATDSITYDSYGRESSLSTPSGSLTGFEYYPEGELASFAPGPVQGRTRFYYTATGQLEVEDNPITMGVSNYFLDGTPLPAGGCCITSPDGNQNFYTDVTVDTRNLLVIGSDAEGSDGSVVADAPYDYDADGRVLDVQSPTIYDNGQSWGWMTSYNDIYTYDAEDHTMTSGFQFLESGSDGGQGGYVGANPNHYYAWGPNGHPVTDATSGGIYQGLHWDGSSLSYSTGSNGSVSDYKLGFDGDMLPSDPGYSGATYYDRNSSGDAIANHNASGHSALQPYAAQAIPPQPPGWVQPGGYGTATGHQPVFGDSSGTAFTYNREDGITNGEVTIQGVRNFSGDTQQWTTPDAYAGEIHDPMSQAKYMWNHNNPIEYSDPSGYDEIWLYADPAPKGHLGQEHLWLEVRKPHGVEERYSFGPKTGVGSPLVRRSDYDKEHEYGRGTANHVRLGSCVNTCTVTKGGFDEASLPKNAAEIEKMGLPYLFFTSNSAARALCGSGGGGNKCDLDNDRTWGWPIKLPPPNPQPRLH